MHFLLCSVFKHSWSACPDPPTSLNVSESRAQRKRRTLVAPDMNLSLDQSEGSVLSDDFLETPDDLDINVDDIETPDETDSLEFINNGNELEWEGQTTLIILERCMWDVCWNLFKKHIWLCSQKLQPTVKYIKNENKH